MSEITDTGSVEVVGRRPAGGALGERLRWIFVRALAGALAGVVVLGIGGRLAMLASRLLHPDRIGALTEGGNVVGQVTVEGTVALILFGGLASGLSAGAVWVLVREWMPDHWAAVGVATVALGGHLLVSADNADFTILGDTRPDIVLLLALLFVAGAAVHALDRRLERVIPPVRGRVSLAVFTVLLLLGAPLVPPTFGQYFLSEFCFCTRPPRITGAFLLLTAAVTVTAWVGDLRGRIDRPDALRRSGQVLLAGAVVAGIINLVGEVSRIV